MEIAKMIIDYCLKAIDRVDVMEEKTTLTIAKKLIENLPSYQADDALKAIFQEVEDA